MSLQPQNVQNKTPQALQQEKQQTQQREWFEQLIASDNGVDHADSKNKISWLQHLRENARQSINVLPALNQKQEAWRYNRVHNIFKNTFDPKSDMSHEINKTKLKTIYCHRLIVITWFL